MTDDHIAGTAEEFRDFFAEVFATMDAEPVSRRFKVRSAGLEIGYEDGDPVFTVAGRSVRADFRRRWLPEHPVPVRPGRNSVFSFIPTTGNRVKVRIK